jgi:hypothetical protein
MSRVKSNSHLIIPDVQARIEDDFSFLSHIGHYIVDKKPDTIVCLGDFVDMKSLSSYDMGKKAAEGARVTKDIAASHLAMDALMKPIYSYNEKRARNKKAQYKPRMVLTLGNHENRINRYINDYPHMADFLSTDALGFQHYGWEVHQFLEPVVIDGIKYAHFFPRGPNGRVMQSTRGAPSARAQVMREGMSCTAGHLQGLDWAVLPNGTGANYGLICGSCYLHEEDYLTPQGTQYWRGIVVKHDVRDGDYDPMFVSLEYLNRRYG